MNYIVYPFAFVFLLASCISKPISNNGVTLLSQDTIPDGCSIVDSFQTHSRNKIKSFHELTDKTLPVHVDIALYSNEQHSIYVRKNNQIEYEKRVDEYYRLNPEEKYLPLHFGETIPIAYKYTDKSIKHYYGVILSCDEK